jgi:succinoglycan biosynthesis protein ExoM
MQNPCSGRPSSEPPAAGGVGRIDVCVCTYRRPQLAKTLVSLAGQALPQGLKMRVLVADNDTAPTARPVILDLAGRLGLDLVYLHAPARNISVARNACLEMADAAWLAFIDDDEQATPGWLAALVAEAGRGGWDAVLGPVRAQYGAEAPEWLAAGRFHATEPVWVRGRILTGYTSNALVARSPVERLRLRFDPRLGRSGGEDVDFFYRFTDGGFAIGYAPAAVVEEAVPPERLTTRWLVMRKFRAGQTHGARLARSGRGLRRLRHLCLAMAKVVYCGLGALANLPRPVARMRFALRGTLHLGVIFRLMGAREVELY